MSRPTRLPVPFLRPAGVLFAALLSGLSPAAALQTELDGPEVYKLDWNTRALTTGDLDGDGREDVVVINNQKARIDLLLQRDENQRSAPAEPSTRRRRWEPVLEDARFQRKSIITGLKAFDVAVGDLDGDGRPEIVYTGEPDGLTVRYRGSDGEWERTQVIRDLEPTPWHSSLAIEDVDGDGTAELIVLAEREVRIYRHDGPRGLSPPERYPLSDEGCYGLTVQQVDDDRRPDLVYLVPQDEHAWRVRLQLPDGRFGPERAFRFATPRRRLQPLPWSGKNVFASVHARTGLIEFSTLARPDSPPAAELAVRTYSTPTRDNGPQHFALGDVTGDGRLDLLVGDRKGAQVWLWEQGEDGSLAPPTAYPSLSDLRSVAAGDIDGDGIQEIIVASRDEKLVGVSRRLSDGRLSYPEPVASGGQPLAATAADLDGDERAEVIWLDRRERIRSVVVQRRQGAKWSEAQRLELADLQTDPYAIEAADLNQDGRMDIAVFTLKSPLRLLLQGEDGKLAEASAEKSFRRGLLDDLLPAGFTMEDIDGDDRLEMIVSGRKGFARAVRFDPEGQLQVVDQFNSGRGEVPVNGTFVADLDGDGVPEVLLIQPEAGEIEVLTRDATGVYRASNRIPTPLMEPVDARVVDLDADGVDDLLLFGRDRFWTAPAGRVDLHLQTLATHEPDIEEIVYIELAAGDLDGDGNAEMVALDSSTTRILQILERSPAGREWQGALHFPVFDPDAHYQARQGSRTEPRELLVRDLDGDGRADIILLVHDRVLIYWSVPRDHGTT